MLVQRELSECANFCYYKTACSHGIKSKYMTGRVCDWRYRRALPCRNLCAHWVDPGSTFVRCVFSLTMCALPRVVENTCQPSSLYPDNVRPHGSKGHKSSLSGVSGGNL